MIDKWCDKKIEKKNKSVRWVLEIKGVQKSKRYFVQYHYYSTFLILFTCLLFYINIRFHELAEFDEAKRSCRRRLARHNERRRRKSTTSAAAGGARNEGRSTGISIKGQDHPLERHCRDKNNNNADDWRRIQMNMARGSGYYKYFHFRWIPMLVLPLFCHCFLACQGIIIIIIKTLLYFNLLPE